MPAAMVAAASGDAAALIGERRLVDALRSSSNICGDDSKEAATRGTETDEKSSRRSQSCACCGHTPSYHWLLLAFCSTSAALFAVCCRPPFPCPFVHCCCIAAHACSSTVAGNESSQHTYTSLPFDSKRLEHNTHTHNKNEENEVDVSHVSPPSCAVAWPSAFV